MAALASSAAAVRPELLFFLTQLTAGAQFQGKALHFTHHLLAPEGNEEQKVHWPWCTVTVPGELESIYRVIDTLFCLSLPSTQAKFAVIWQLDESIFQNNSTITVSISK